MNKLVEEQLLKVQFADLSNYDPKEKEYIIPKRVDIRLVEGKVYIIELEDKCFDTSAILNINWNKGNIPKHRAYKAEIVSLNEKAVKISGLAYNLETGKDLLAFWEGYVPINSINVLQQVGD